MRYVVVGASIAGLSAAEAIRDADPGGEVVLISEEPHPPYCRPLISYWLAGDAPEALFPLPSPALETVRQRTGTKAVSLDPAGRTVSLDTGETLAYDRLLLATGSASKRLGLEGEDAPNVLDFRTLADARAIDRLIAGGARRAIVLGGGLVGVKAATALTSRGVETLLCITSPAPLSQVVDDEAGQRAARALRTEGIDVRTGYAAEALTREGGRVTAVRFSRPEAVEPCDLVIRGKGASPRVELFEGTGVDASRGVPVDPFLRTPLAGVWAAGDCVRCRDVVRGDERTNAIWPVAVEQGRVAGRNMTGGKEPYAGSYARNSLRIGGLHVVSAGLLRPPAAGYEVIRTTGPRGEGYHKIVCRDGVIVGFVSVESARPGPCRVGRLVAAVAGGTRLDELPDHPLEPPWAKGPRP